MIEKLGDARAALNDRERSVLAVVEGESGDADANRIASASPSNRRESSADLGEQVQHVVGVLLFHLVDLLDQYLGGRIGVAQPSDDF